MIIRFKNSPFHKKYYRTMQLRKLLILLGVNVALQIVGFQIYVYIKEEERILNTNSVITKEKDSNLTAVKIPPNVLPISQEVKKLEVLLNVLPSSEEDNNYHFVHFDSKDSSMKYSIQRFSITGDRWSELTAEHRICFGSHASIDKLDWLIELSRTWDGPLSISLFLPNLEYEVARLSVQYLRKCFPDIRDNVSFHFIFPVRHSGQQRATYSNYSCDEDPYAVLKQINKSIPRKKVPMKYPQNILRNLAKDGCQTDYVMVPDIDMMPQPGLTERLNTFLSAQDCPKCAYVLPTYEIKDSVGALSNMPQTKTELVGLIRKGRARRFHIAVYADNQRSSNLGKWEQLVPGEGAISVAYEARFRFMYEPVYIAKAGVLPFDERFIGYGFTRNTQAYEMLITGYKFLLLNNAFLNHWGFQSGKAAWKKAEVKENTQRLVGFIADMIRRYGRDPLNVAEWSGIKRAVDKLKRRGKWPKGMNDTKKSFHMP